MFKSKKTKEKEAQAKLDDERSQYGSIRSRVQATLPTSSNPRSNVPPMNDAYARPSNTNPYATSAGVNDPYAPKSQSSLTQPPTSSFSSLTLNSEGGNRPPSYRSSPAPDYGHGSGSRYHDQGSYGQSHGYGSSDPYGSGQQQQQQSRYGLSGYGGFGGRRASEETITTDAGRQELFGDAAQRAKQNASQASGPAAQQGEDHSYANAGGYSSGGYGGYGEDRELTAEEQEEQDIQGTKDQIRDIKRSDVATTRNALTIAAQIEQTGRDTLARLGQQGDRLHNAEHHLDVATFQNKQAEDKAKELKKLNRSMFRPMAGNPFTRESRAKEALDNAVARRQHERQTLQDTREAAYASQTRQQEAARNLRGEVVGPQKQRNLADRSKYQFEADSDDDAMEDEIEDNLFVGLLAKFRVETTLTKATGIRYTTRPSSSTSLDRRWGRNCRARMHTWTGSVGRRTRWTTRLRSIGRGWIASGRSELSVENWRRVWAGVWAIAVVSAGLLRATESHIYNSHVRTSAKV